MKIYLASSYSRREEVVEYARLLEEDGHVSTAYRLTDECSDWPPQRCAANDAANLTQSEAIVCCTGTPTTSGGHHVEFGMAVVLGLRLVVVGPRQNVFHHRADVEQYNTFEEARQVLKHGLPPPKGGDAS